MPGPKRPSLDTLAAERIALLKPSALGDVVQTLPVLTALRQRFPQAQITWIVNSSYALLLQGHPDLDHILPFDRTASSHGKLSALRGWVGFLTELRRRRFDLVLDLQGLFRTGLMVLATGAPRRVGLSTAREGSSWSYTDHIQVDRATHTHAVARYWRVIEELGVGHLPHSFHVPISPQARTWASQVLQSSARPWLMLGPGARWVTKRWPAEHFAALARRFQDAYGGSVFFVGGRDETPLARAVGCTLTGTWHDFTGQTTLPQLAALLARADVMLANDTGPLHLAAALGRPVVAPYTCTSVRRSGPYGCAGGAVETRVVCAGSYRKRCGHRSCMSELTPQRLWPVLDEALQAWHKRPRLSA